MHVWCRDITHDVLQMQHVQSVLSQNCLITAVEPREWSTQIARVVHAMPHIYIALYNHKHFTTGTKSDFINSCIVSFFYKTEGMSSIRFICSLKN